MGLQWATIKSIHVSFCVLTSSAWSCLLCVLWVSDTHNAGRDILMWVPVIAKRFTSRCCSTGWSSVFFWGRHLFCCGLRSAIPENFPKRFYGTKSSDFISTPQCVLILSKLETQLFFGGKALKQFVLLQLETKIPSQICCFLFLGML